MTEEQIEIEWEYRRLERESILTDGKRPPTTQEMLIARAESDLWLADYLKHQALQVGQRT